MSNEAKGQTLRVKSNAKLRGNDLRKFADRHGMTLAEAQNLADRLGSSPAAMEAAVRLFDAVS